LEAEIKTETQAQESQVKKTRLEILQERKEKLDREFKAELTKAKEKERKNRAHNLIKLGGLLLKARLQDVEKSVLMGAFLEIADTIQNNPAKCSTWKEKGIEELKKGEE
jgi:tRNA C32,U32 (ribose-2'-O)-methylase TrmJ